MIYKLQRLYSKEDKGNKNTGQQEIPQQPQKPSQPVEQPQQTQKQASKQHRKYTALENEKERLREMENLGGDTAYVDEFGKRRTQQNIDAEYETRKSNINELNRQREKVKRLERQEARKAKFNKAKNQAGKWVKKNKKGLIIGGSIAGVGTGAAIIGSKIHKKNKQNKIKEDIRGYSNVED